CGHAEARRHAYRPSVAGAHAPFAEAAAYPLRKEHGAVEVRLRKHDRELLTADASRQVDVAELGSHDFCTHHEYGVSGLMAVPVVDALEVVEIGEHDREASPEALDASLLPLEHLHEPPAIRELRELVGRCLLLDDLMEPSVLERSLSVRGERLHQRIPDRVVLRRDAVQLDDATRTYTRRPAELDDE